MPQRRVREVLQRASPPSPAELQQWVDEAGIELQLVPPGPPYEASVCEGRVPTREDSWHDTFNVLAFIAWPRAKRALHARVAALQSERRRPIGVTSRHTSRSPRSREEDALTLLDETALVVTGDADTTFAFDEARRAGAWGEVTSLVETRRLEVRWFGHALLEHLVLRRPPVGAGVVVLRGGAPVGRIGGEQSEDPDTQLTQAIETGHFDTPRFGPTVPWPHATVLGWVGLNAEDSVVADSRILGR